MEPFYKFVIALASLFTLYLMFIQLLDCCHRSLQGRTGGGNHLQRAGELGTVNILRGEERGTTERNFDPGNATGGEAAAGAMIGMGPVGNTGTDNGNDGVVDVERGTGGRGNNRNENEGDGAAADVMIKPGFEGGSGGHNVNGGVGGVEKTSGGCTNGNGDSSKGGSAGSEGVTGHNGDNDGDQMNVHSAVVLAGQMDARRPEK